MFRWLEKKTYAKGIKERLAQEGCQGIYPTALVDELASVGLEITQEHAKRMHSFGEQFSNSDFEAFFGAVVSPLVKVLVINGKFERAVKSPGVHRGKVIETFETHFGGGKAEQMKIDEDHLDHVEELLSKHGVSSHVRDLRVIMF